MLHVEEAGCPLAIELRIGSTEIARYRGHENQPVP